MVTIVWGWGYIAIHLLASPSSHPSYSFTYFWGKGHVVKGYTFHILRILTIDLDKTWKIKTLRLLLIGIESKSLEMYKILLHVFYMPGMGVILPSMHLPDGMTWVIASSYKRMSFLLWVVLAYQYLVGDCLWVNLDLNYRSSSDSSILSSYK